MAGLGDSAGALWFCGVVAALLVLFATGLRLRTPASGLARWLARGGIVGAAAAAAVLANVALYRHDLQFDLTRERAFTPSGEAQEIVRGLSQPVQLTFFYQKQDPAGRGAAAIVQLLARLNPYLEVEAVDSDQHPALANQLGVQVYNTAVVRAGDRRIQVVTTDEEEIALAILRAVRARETVVCFATGHGEYDIDNFEFHTHFEGTQSHSHNVEGVGVVQIQQHGLGRLRRTIEKLGLVARKTPVAGGQPVPPDCAALVEANPRTRYTGADSAVLRAYLARGGSVLMMVEPDYPVDETLAGALAEAGIRLGDGFVVDPVDHYFTDEQMIAVTKYSRHPITRGLALSIYPGARPVETGAAAHAAATVLFSTSAQGYAITDRLREQEEAAEAPRGAIPLAAAAEGRLGPGDPFRIVVFGDADFASNSFFPYLANADMVLGSISWLIREERAPVVKPPVEVLPTLALTGSQVRAIFITTVLVLPGSVALLGALVWWRRRA
ncbi:MAG: GldG family protein [Alphaproteobacteria bacterium]|nr:GldG family protein [Alphaproteobacteria bacterium]